MIDLDLQTALFLLATAVVGFIAGWLIRNRSSNRSLNQMGDQWQRQFDRVVQQKEKLTDEIDSLNSSIEAQQAAAHEQAQATDQSRSEIEPLREKINTLSKNLSVLGEERDELRSKLGRVLGLVDTQKKQISDQDETFGKASEFYKGQLEGALEKRTALERKLDDAKSENDSLRNMLMSTKAEHESVSNRLTAALSEPENPDAIEQRVIVLEAENAELRQAATQVKGESEALQQDVDEIEALKAQNRELALCLESSESSRKQYESDANRYRTQYEESEKQSERLRFKLGDLKQNSAEMQRKGNNKRNSDATRDAPPPPFGLNAPQGEPDKLTEIIGVGKVFEATLHSLGVYHYHQIAAFGPSEIARINTELKEFRGRIENDDWVGQAKKLHLKKFGNSSK